ncbi:hypothetical protein MMPV_004915 [Pyropia vietnamensis]
MWIRLKRRGVCLELLVRDDAVLPPPAASADGGGIPTPSPLLSDTIYTNGAAGTRAGAADLARAFGGPTASDAAVAAILATGVPRRPASAAAVVTAARAAATLGVLLSDYVDARTGRVLRRTDYLGKAQNEGVLLDLAAAAAAVGLPVGAHPGVSPAVAAARLASALAYRGGPLLTPGPLVAEFALPVAAASATLAAREAAVTCLPSSPPKTPFWAGCPALTVTWLPPVLSPPASAAIEDKPTAADFSLAEHPADVRVTLRPADWERFYSWADARRVHCLRNIPPAQPWSGLRAGDSRRRAAVAGADNVTPGGKGVRHCPPVPPDKRGKGGRKDDRGGRRAARARGVARRAARDERWECVARSDNQERLWADN